MNYIYKPLNIPVSIIGIRETKYGTVAMLHNGTSGNILERPLSDIRPSRRITRKVWERGIPVMMDDGVIHQMVTVLRADEVTVLVAYVGYDNRLHHAILPTLEFIRYAKPC